MINPVSFILHIDKHLGYLLNEYGALSYAILFLIVFAETGLVIIPFLPGDSLLFAAGALTASLGALNVHILVLLLIIAAVLGDAVNYYIGSKVGLKVFSGPPNANLLRKYVFRDEYLKKTQGFYEKYGSKTIIIARFVPIVRTFAPFLAGVANMSYPRFAVYNIAGGVLWVAGITYAGYFFGGIPIIQKNFGLVVIGIIFVSILPIIFEFAKEYLKQKPAENAQ